MPSEAEAEPIPASVEEQCQMSGFLRQYTAARAMRGIGASLDRVCEILKQAIPSLDPNIAWWTAYVGVTFVDRVVLRLSEDYVRLDLRHALAEPVRSVKCPRRGETSVITLRDDPLASLILEGADEGVFVTLEGAANKMRVYRHGILKASVATGQKILIWLTDTILVDAIPITLRAGTPSQQLAFVAPKGPPPDELPVRLTPPQIWALGEAVDYFEKDLLPDFRGRHGYLFARAADARHMIQVMRGLMRRHEWIRRWDGYFRLQAQTIQSHRPTDCDRRI